MKDLVEYIAKALVEQPESVSVETASGDEGEDVIELRVAPEDRGRVIGKNGRTAHAIRTLLSAIQPEGKNTTLEILD
ncbi:MAG: KH domain-containing protein [Myxococcota bacterium]|nr:KH domain-containing protein [Myxococcota bacterium]